MEKTVLCVFGERKRPVTFKGSTDPVKDRKNLLEAVLLCYSDVLQGSEVGHYFLQQESVEWGGWIDLSGIVQDRSTVRLCSSGKVGALASWKHTGATAFFFAFVLD